MADESFWHDWYSLAQKANGEFVFDPYRSRANLIDIAGMIQHETGDTLSTLPTPAGFNIHSFFSSLYHFVGARAAQTKEALYTWIVQPVRVHSAVLFVCGNRRAGACIHMHLNRVS